MIRANTSWPPLIVAERVPRLIRWRDALLTLTMWVVFAVLVRIEFAPVLTLLQAFGFADFGLRHDLPLYFEKLAPFVIVAIVLAGLLALFSLQTEWRRSRSLRLSPPPPLNAADQARRAGLDEATLHAAREMRVVTVHTTQRGVRIESTYIGAST